MTVFRRSSHLDWRFARDVGDEKVHGDVLTVYLIVHELFDVSRLGICVHIAVILKYRNTKICSLSLARPHSIECNPHNIYTYFMMECCSSEYDREVTHPLRFIAESSVL